MPKKVRLASLFTSSRYTDTVIDKATRERIEARHGLENYIFNLRNQANDESGLGSKIDDDDKEELLSAVQAAREWLEEHGPSATTEEFEEQKEALSNVAYPITSKLYGEAGSDESSGHDEL